MEYSSAIPKLSVTLIRNTVPNTSVMFATKVSKERTIHGAYDSSSDNPKQTADSEPVEPTDAAALGLEVKKNKKMEERTCPVCEKQFDRPSVMKLHLSCVQNDICEFTCEICSKKLKRKDSLKKHLESHKDSNAKPFQCDQCEKAFKRKRDLEVLFRRHSGTKDMLCSLCGMNFRQEWSFESHNILVHHHKPSKMYSCDSCGKVFKMKWHLDQHLMSKSHGGRRLGIAANGSGRRMVYRMNLKNLKSLRNAFGLQFPQATLRGCFSHFRQANVKHIKADAELRDLRSKDSDWSLELKKVVALAFVPTRYVLSSFETLESSPPFAANSDALDRYLDYFMNTWIGGFDRRGERKRPLYGIEGWNCRDSVLQGLPKTNNYCESFHQAFATLLAAHHPTLDILVVNLLKKQRLTECAMEQFIAGTQPAPKPQSVKAAEKLKVAVERYGTLSTSEFLRGVAYNFSLE